MKVKREFYLLLLVLSIGSNLLGQGLTLGIDLTQTQLRGAQLNGCGIDTLLNSHAVHWLTLADTGTVSITLRCGEMKHCVIVAEYGGEGLTGNLRWWDADSTQSGSGGIALPAQWFSVQCDGKLLVLRPSVVQLEMMGGMAASLMWGDDPLVADPFGNLRLFPGDFLFTLIPAGGLPLDVTYEIQP